MLWDWSSGPWPLTSSSTTSWSPTTATRPTVGLMMAGAWRSLQRARLRWVLGSFLEKLLKVWTLRVRLFYQHKEGDIQGQNPAVSAEVGSDKQRRWSQAHLKLRLQTRLILSPPLLSSSLVWQLRCWTQQRNVLGSGSSTSSPWPYRWSSSLCSAALARWKTHTHSLFISVLSAKPHFTGRARVCVCPQRSSDSADGQLSLSTLQEEFDGRHLSHSSSSSLRVTAPACVCVLQEEGLILKSKS